MELDDGARSRARGRGGRGAAGQRGRRGLALLQRRRDDVKRAHAPAVWLVQQSVMMARRLLIAVVTATLCASQEVGGPPPAAVAHAATEALHLSTASKVYESRRRLAISLSLHAAAVAGADQTQALHEAMDHIQRCLVVEPQDYQLLFFAAVNTDRLLRESASAASRKATTGKLRSYCTMARGSMATQQPLANLRYIYTICCDQLRPVGGDSPGSPTHKLREACWHEAVAQGAWQSIHQRPMDLNASLASRAVWSLRQLHDSVRRTRPCLAST
jgi:hypothetical protein